MVGYDEIRIFLDAQNDKATCQSLEKLLIPSTATSCGLAKFRVVGDYTIGNEYI
jgi:hypothetical protein